MLHTHEVTGSSPVVSTRYYIEDLCNGSTPDSDSVCGGSNPSSSARSTVVARLQWTFFASRALRFHRSALDASYYFSIKWLTPFYPANPSQAAGGGEKCMDLRFLRLRRWLLKQQPNKTVFNRFIEN